MKHHLLALVFLGSLINAWTTTRAEEIGFIEDFALAGDRETALATLIPGTEPYFYYHTLHYQNVGRLGDAKATLDAWISKLGQSEKVREMRIRQMLLAYPENAQSTLDFLRSEFGLNLNHSAPQRDAAANLSTKLDPAVIDWSKRFKEAVTTGNRLEQIEEVALGEALGLIEYQPDIRAWLQRVLRPDLSGVVDTIVKELKLPDSQGFGWATIHRNLTLEQLDQLKKQLPKLIESESFVNVYLTRLRPSDDESLSESKTRREYLDRLQAFTESLPESQNSLKASVLYHRLKLDLNESIIDRERFIKYLSLPRQAGYVNTEWVRQQSMRPAINFHQDYSASTTLLPIGDDSELIGNYLEHFFQSDKEYDAFAKYLDRDYLKQIFATTKILYGLGDAKMYYPQLSPGQQKEVQERVELRFLPSNPPYFSPNDRVQLAVSIKNVPQVIVKIYRLNPKNILRAQSKNVSTAIDLDGLVANVERTVAFSQAKERRHSESLDFPELEGRGVWVVDLLGGGQRSRALIQKGQLRSLRSITDSGHLLKIVDETGKPVPSARVLLGEREFSPTDDGAIILPFASTQENRPITLVDGNFASLEQLTHLAESYQLNAGFVVESQSLRPGTKAAVVVRTQLTCNGVPIPISLLEQPQLTITATDQDGIQTSQTYSAIKLSDAIELSQTFLVPQRLVLLAFTLHGKVHNLSQAIRQPISASQSMAVNGTAATTQIGDFYLTRHASGYQLEVRGRNGEPLSRLPVQLQFKLQGIQHPVHAQLATNEAGIVELGMLEKVERLWSVGSGTIGAIQQREFVINETWLNWPTTLHLLEGQSVEVSWPETDELAKKDMQRFSLIEYRGGQVVKSWSKQLKIVKGKIVAEKLPAGSYRLSDHRTESSIEIDVTRGVSEGGYLIGRHRAIEENRHVVPTVSSSSFDGKQLVIQLDGNDGSTRVHLLATSFDRSLGDIKTWQSVIPPPHRLDRSKLPSFFLDSMRLDEEYQYVLQRQLAKKYLGSMLPQPSVLLNPWELSVTSNESQSANAGDAILDMAAVAPKSDLMRRKANQAQQAAVVGGPSSFDFLLRGSVFISNLRPDSKGRVSIDATVLEGLTNVVAVVVHPDGTTYRRLGLPLDKHRELFDKRLAKAFEQDKKLAERQIVRLIDGGQKTDLGDANSTRVKLYGSLSEVFSLYATYLNQNADFQNFQAIQTWTTLSETEKQVQFMSLACHEFHLFLYYHDRDFFDKVVKPYIANKLEKQFIDDWLLDRDLASYAQPWRLARMNAAERALLAVRLTSQRDSTARYFNDSLDAQPATSHYALRNARFGTALLGDLLGKSIEDRQDQFYFGIAEGMHDAPASATANFDAEGGAGRMAGGMGGGRNDLRLEKSIEEEIASADKKSFGSYRSRRDSDVRQLYRTLEATRKWAETQYYHVELANQNLKLAPINLFWRDLVEHAARDSSSKEKAKHLEHGFISKHLDVPVSTLSEALMALAILQLPIEAKPVELSVEDGRILASHPTPAVAYIQSIESIEASKDPASILVGQDIYLIAPGDSSQAKPVQDKPMLTNVAYRATVALTNPSSTAQRVQVLTQIPQGAIPLSGGKMVRGTTLELGAYSSQQVSYDFYFPTAGSFAHYGAQVSNDSGHLASATSASLRVLEKPETVDDTTWAYVSAWGSNEQVFAYLNKANLQQLDLSAIAWRLQDRAFFISTIELLTKLGRFDATLWAYAVKHNEAKYLTEWLESFSQVTSSVGPVLKSNLLNVEPVERFAYQHFDFRPVIVARIHQLGSKRMILNDGLAQQYQQFMNCLAYQSSIDHSQRLSLVYYLVIQNRIEEAMAQFDSVDVDSIDQDLQYDYFAAVFELYRGQYKAAENRAMKYVKYPQPRWRDWFSQVRDQVSAREKMQRGEQPDEHAVDDWKTDEQQRLLSGSSESDQKLAADKLPALDLVDESGTIKVQYRNVERLVVNYYLMDIELLFSRKPFVQYEGSRLSSIEPNESEIIELAEGTNSRTLSIPEKLRNRNLVFEVVGAKLTRSHVIYANSLNVALSTSMGRLQTTTKTDRKPLAGAYVKVYARHQDGSVRFFKDGYTDLRGQFEYASLSTNDLDTTQRFSILVLHPEHGALIREAEPPKK